MNELQQLFNKNKYDSAINLLEKNLSNYLPVEEQSELLYQIAKIYFYQKKYGKAENMLIQSMEKNTTNENALLYLGLIYEQRGRYLDAIKVLKYLYNNTTDYKHVWNKILGIIDKIELNEKLYPTNNEPQVKPKNPLVSIMILCYNKVEYTAKCLSSLFENTVYDNFEVIVIDNASVDKTSDLLECYGPRIKFIRSSENLGFVNGNNLACDYAEGDYYLFLNNDTEVKKYWLYNLMQIFDFYPDAGAVGSKLIYPDGKLQEAGGIIFNDGSGWNYGKNGDLTDSNYGFVREVDYCSGASLIIKSNLFNRLGKFDTRFSPAYYEDTDLCFGVRKLGYKVYYTPLSNVIHHEGITSGTDLNSGFKRFQNINRQKFIEKWKDELKFQSKPTAKNIIASSNRKKGKSILIFDDIPPFPDRASGALRHYHILEQLLNLGFKVTYVHLMGKEYTDESSQKYFNYFKTKGVEFCWFNYEGWWNFRNTTQAEKIKKGLVDSISLREKKFDYIYIAFWFIADYFIDYIKEQVPSTPIFIDTVDVHFLRELRKAELTNDQEKIKEAEENKTKEINTYKKADALITVTENDRDVLLKELPNKATFILPNVHPKVADIPGINNRKDLLFVGNFNHDPNEDAVIYFVENIFPRIKQVIPEIKLYIVGNNPTVKIKSLDSDNIVVTGWVPEIKPYLEMSRVSVVPLRYGAGMKGKVGETLSYGLPMVSTTIGVEGMGIENGIHSFITDDPKTFADYVIELYSNEELWNKFSTNGKKLIDNKYSDDAMRERLKFLFTFQKKEQFKSEKALKAGNPPKISIVIPTYGNIKYTLECLKSIKITTRLNYEIIVVDNNSSDSTVSKISKQFIDLRLIENAENLGFPRAVNLGINAALGNYIIIANNDIVLTKHSLDRMIEIAESDEKIGIVGPISNIVSGMQLDKEAKYDSIEEMHKYAERISKKNKGQVQQFPRVAFLCTLIKRELIDKIGGLDERFSPGNFEDDDFCLRAQLAGYKTVIAKDVFIHHYGSKSFKANGEAAYAERMRINQKKFVDKWGADPNDIWLKGKQIKQRSITYPINNSVFIEAFTRALNHSEDNELDLALLEAERAIEHFDNCDRTGFEKIEKIDVINLTANLALQIGDYEKAQDYFKTELELDPNSSRACLGLAETFFAAELFEEAKTMYEWAIKNGDNRKEIWDKLSIANTKLGLDPKNYTLELSSVETSPTLQDAEELINKSDLVGAEKILMHLLGKNNQAIDVLNDLAVIKIMQNNLEEALNYINKVIQIDPQNEIAIENLKYIETQVTP